MDVYKGYYLALGGEVVVKMTSQISAILNESDQHREGEEDEPSAFDNWLHMQVLGLVNDFNKA